MTETPSNHQQDPTPSAPFKGLVRFLSDQLPKTRDFKEEDHRLEGSRPAKDPLNEGATCSLHLWLNGEKAEPAPDDTLPELERDPVIGFINRTRATFVGDTLAYNLQEMHFLDVRGRVLRFTSEYEKGKGTTGGQKLLDEEEMAAFLDELHTMTS